jgi:hypothetical protein
MKRSPLRRKTKLHQGKTSLRRTALRRVGKRREREAEALAEFSRKLIPLALCSECRRNDTLDAHHLCSRARGAGHPKLHDKRNRAWLCRPCHEAAHRGDLPHLIKSRDYLDNLD